MSGYEGNSLIVAVLQARLGSTRLPGKVLKDICGHPMLWHQIQRMKLAKSLGKIIVATTDQPEDRAVISVAEEAGVQWFAGSAEDVLDRMYQAVKNSDATEIVRLTGDCPLVDPAVIDQVVTHYMEHRDGLDHVNLAPEWPEGFDAEILSFELLEQIWRKATKRHEREHVTTHVTLSGKFRTYRLPCAQDLSNLRLTVDEPVDFEVVREIYEELYPKFGHDFSLSEILKLFQRQPEIFERNMDIQRNEGLLKSLCQEGFSGAAK